MSELYRDGERRHSPFYDDFLRDHGEGHRQDRRWVAVRAAGSVRRYQITATGSNVITLGDGNVVNAEFADLHRNLDELKEAIANSQDLTEAVKLDLTVDVESIKDHLAKPVPNKSVVRQLWAGLERVSTEFRRSWMRSGRARPSAASPTRTSSTPRPTSRTRSSRWSVPRPWSGAPTRTPGRKRSS
jgi:hypothetical protein